MSTDKFKKLQTVRHRPLLLRVCLFIYAAYNLSVGAYYIAINDGKRVDTINRRLQDNNENSKL